MRIIGREQAPISLAELKQKLAGQHHLSDETVMLVIFQLLEQGRLTLGVSV